MTISSTTTRYVTHPSTVVQLTKTMEVTLSMVVVLANVWNGCSCVGKEVVNGIYIVKTIRENKSGQENQ